MARPGYVYVTAYLPTPLWDRVLATVREKEETVHGRVNMAAVLRQIVADWVAAQEDQNQREEE